MINSVKGSYTSEQSYNYKSQKVETSKETEQAQAQTTSDTIEIGATSESSVTYSKTVSKGSSAEEIQKLWDQAEKSTETLRKLVENLISGQGGKEALASARADAQKAISDDGEYGVEAVSDRIVNFAIALSGGDKTKLDELKGAIDKGFQAAEKAFGGTLPDVSQKTYDAIMEKLDKWSQEEE